jgi:hypothetical protein
MKSVCRTLVLALSFTACRTTADLLNSAPVAPRTVLSLQPAPMQGDTIRVTISQGAGPTRSVGSLSGEVLLPPQWTFTSCVAAQGEPLLACKAHAQSVKVAAAWVTGTHVGDLVTLTFVRTTPSAPSTWELAVQEVHSVAGASLLDSLDVRREIGGGA